MITEYFKSGINLGGWLSQYEIIEPTPEKLQQHLNNFITNSDIEKIKSWGYDHVRIPVDGNLLLDDQGILRNDILCYLDKAISWCAEVKLNVIIDLHNIKGHIFGQMDKETPLFTNPSLNDLFVSFWGQMSAHYTRTQNIKLMYELFNEMAAADNDHWNQLYSKTVRAIRQNDHEHFILIGSNYVNSVAWLSKLDVISDPLTAYNFHYYEPNVFTHQKAHFSEEFIQFNQTMSYPGDLSEYHSFLKDHPQYVKDHPLITLEHQNDSNLMDNLLHMADDFQRNTKRELMCTEFGVIDTAPENEAIKWLRDFTSKCNERHIGHTMWNYKELDFEIVNIKNEIVRPALLKEIVRENNSLLQ